MNIQFKKIDPAAKLPTYAHPGDAGMDVYTNETLLLAPGERHAFTTGVAMSIPDGYVGLVWDRSGLAVKQGITTLAGVIDSGYRGEIKIAILNTGDQPVQIATGEKIAQLLIQPIERATVEEVQNLDDSHRGTDGFGSTGK